MFDDQQLDAAEEAVSKVIDPFSDNGDQFEVCVCYRLLGDIYHSRGEIEKAINHFQAALGIASCFNWSGRLVWIHYSLAVLFFGENRFDDAHAHIESAKSHATSNPYNLGRMTELQAKFWYEQHMLTEAKSGALCAADIYEKLGASEDVGHCRALLRNIEEAASHELAFEGELLETVLFATPANSPSSASGAGHHRAS